MWHCVVMAKQIKMADIDIHPSGTLCENEVQYIGKKLLNEVNLCS